MQSMTIYRAPHGPSVSTGTTASALAPSLEDDLAGISSLCLCSLVAKEAVSGEPNSSPVVGLGALECRELLQRREPEAHPAPWA